MDSLKPYSIQRKHDDDDDDDDDGIVQRAKAQYPW